ncbi:MAG: glycosyltransferase family 4 protein [Desulfobacterales bacterium]
MKKDSIIASPMCWGNGAYVIHKELEKGIPGYRVLPYHPYWTLFPVYLPLAVRINRPGLVHTTPDYAAFFKRKNIPLVVTFHNFVLDSFMNQYSSWVQRIHYAVFLRGHTKIAVRHARAVTSVSRFTADMVRCELGYKGPLHVIYDGVDTTRFHPSNHSNRPNDIRVLFSGNLTLRKGAQWLAPIARRLKPGIRIFYTAGLRTKKRLPPASNLVPIGRVEQSEMPTRYQQMDILLMPTVREGFGMAVLEAMACGLPVVASNCSSIPELIDDTKGGFLCPVGDTVAFADRINMLAQSELLRHAMGAYNRAKAEEKFGLDRMLFQYRSLFDQMQNRDLN